ncbi:MAG: helix-turn-helix domain-containing protein [Emcibacter sp.]|nr:helix-turn-helix domain-containing protein [Emcibacter sp.]
MKTEKGNLFPERLKEAAQLVGGPDALAKKSGVPRRTLGNYISGDTEPKLGGLTAISEATGTSLEWLARGEGPIMRDHLLAGDKDGEATSTLAHSAMAVYMALHEAGNLITPEKFEQLTIAMWELDQQYGSEGDQNPDDPMVQAAQKLLMAALKTD